MPLIRRLRRPQLELGLPAVLLQARKLPHNCPVLACPVLSSPVLRHRTRRRTRHQLQMSPEQISFCLECLRELLRFLAR